MSEPESDADRREWSSSRSAEEDESSEDARDEICWKVTSSLDEEAITPLYRLLSFTSAALLDPLKSRGSPV
jgi:hypothetical protein